MVLLRRIIGETLRTRRREQHRTLRDVSASANVSLGYLSEIERGQKEASSELLSSICGALDVPLSDVLGQVTTEVAREESAAVREKEAASLSAVALLRPVSHLDDHRKVAEISGPRRRRDMAVTPPVSLAAARARRARSSRSVPKASVAA